MSSTNLPRARNQTIARLLTRPTFQHNHDRNAEEVHFSETRPIQIVINGSATFHIPRHLLSRSQYLSSRLSYVPHGQRQEILIFGIEVSAFRIYAALLSEGKLALPFQDENDVVGQNAFWNIWAKCYALGRALRDTAFRNRLVDGAIAHMIRNDAQPGCLVRTIYKHSASRSEHRNLCRDLAMHTWRIPDILAVEEGEFKNDLFRDLAGMIREEGVERRRVDDFLVGKIGAYWEEERGS
ncbi:hypothetical protein E8E12_009048 [Didymella heteroderae]|uniref:BTB domain-containing protein n=1 Tax=Didymella heteroderae TaxID=1769908 RepID=A0A9P4WQZ6_9PLEO|nr:hypothetical protein E8E12_009048 [Didymella heteroderae]